MLQVLERYEEIRLDETESWSESYFEIFCQTVIYNVEIFLRVVTMYNKQHYINLLSLSFPYNRTFNTSLVIGSGLRTLIALISSNFKVNGELVIGLLGPLLGLPERTTLSLNLTRLMEENFPTRFFPVIRRNYRYCAEKRSDVIIRLAEILSSGKLNEGIVKGLFHILWDIDIRPDDIGLVVFTLQKNYEVISNEIFSVSSNRHFEVLTRLLEATCFEKKYIYLSYFFFYGLIFSYPDTLRFSNQKEPLDVIFSYLDHILANHKRTGRDSRFLDFCIESLSEDQRSKLVKRLLIQFAIRNSPDGVMEVLNDLHKIFNPADLLLLLKSNLFNCEENVKNENICRNFTSLMKDIYLKFDRDQKKMIRKDILEYFGSNVYLLRAFFNYLQDSEVIEARHFEDKLVQLLEKSPKIDCWKTTSRFNHTNRAKFWKRAEKEFVDDIEGVIYKLGMFNIGRCFNPDFLLNHSARSQYIMAVFKTSEERSDYLRYDIGSFEFRTDAEYIEYGFIYDRLVECERASRYHTPPLDIDSQYEIHQAISSAVDSFSGNIGCNSEYPGFLADLMIRYRIDDEHLFHQIGLQGNYSDKIETYKRLVYNDPPKNSVDLVSVVRNTYYMDEYYSLLNSMEYLNEDTYQALVKKSEDYFESSPAFVCFAHRSNNVKKYKDKIVSIVCKQFRYEELRAIVDIVKHKDLHRDSKLQIYAHWFFVDEMPEENLIWSMNCFVNLCMEI
jgi:hypothetical protein